MAIPVEYKYYEPLSLFNGTFKGKNIYVSTMDQLYRKAADLLNRNREMLFRKLKKAFGLHK